MDQITTTPRVHRTAPVMRERIAEVLHEPDFPVERVYQWAKAGKIRTFYLGPNLCARDDHLIEDLTGASPFRQSPLTKNRPT
jgi:hypothetical protein